MSIGTVGEIWRYAVKSMGGESLDGVRLEAGGIPGDRGWAGAATMCAGELVATASAVGVAGAGYEPGLLALREGPLLAAAVRGLPNAPDVLLVDATGRDHPRRAGLALHLGAVLGLATVGVTHRPLHADGAWPEDDRYAVALFDSQGLQPATSPVGALIQLGVSNLFFLKNNGRFIRMQVTPALHPPGNIHRTDHRQLPLSGPTGVLIFFDLKNTMRITLGQTL